MQKKKKAAPKKKPVIKRKVKKEVKPSKVLRKGEKVGEMKYPQVNSGPDIDWAVMKREFFMSNHGTVSGFLREKELIQVGGRINGHQAKKTRGWQKQKTAIYEDQTIEIREAFRSQAAEYVREMLLPLQEAKRFALNAILERLAQKDDIGPWGHTLKIGDLIQILHIIKVELGEPNEISKSTNLNANIDLNKLIEYVDKSDEPFNRKDFDGAVYGAERIAKLPSITIDGREQSAT